MMIDKLDVRIPSGATFQPHFDRWIRDWGTKGEPSRHYLKVFDLRMADCAAILHFRARQTHDHKLELLVTGKASFAELVNRIQQVVEPEARTLGIMRLDLAVDLEGVPVGAFVGNVRAKWKRSAHEIGRYSMVGKRGPETFYLGKRPNVFRFYNKIEEFRHQYSILKRRSRGPVQTFKEIFGYPESGVVLTRVERQIGGNRIPKEVSTVAQLVNLPEFDPFERLEISVCSDRPNIEDWNFATYLKGLGWAELIRQSGGIQNARRLANFHSKGNASRTLEQLSAFVPAAGYLLTEKQLFEKYRESVQRQLAA